MRVAKLRIENHPGIGGLNIDFREKNGKSARLIVIAGENGTGKTAILQTIYRLLTGNPLGAINPNVEMSILVETNKSKSELEKYTIDGEQIDLSSFSRVSGFDSSDASLTTGVSIQSKSAPIVLPQRVQLNTALHNVTGTKNPCFFSMAEMNFRIPTVQQYSAHIDETPSASPIGAENLGNEIISLLVALKGADAAELADWVAENPDQVPPQEVSERRIKKFREAFGRIMPNKRFIGVESIGNSFHPVFEENGRKTTLSELSSGEKQIVFRGAFLLQQIHLTPGSIILVDEPELGLHPTWQSSILSYYDSIIGDDPTNSGQIIMTTHSPFVVHGSPTAKHIILKKNNQTKQVEVDPEPAYPDFTPGNRAIAAFDLSDISFGRRGNKLAIVTEGPTDANILKVAWEKIRNNAPMPFDVLPGRGASSISSLLGTVEGVPGPLVDATASLGLERFIGLFDFDHEGFPQWNGMAASKRSDDECLDERQCLRRRRKGCMIWAALLPVPPHRANYASHRKGFRSGLTIELLFPDAQVRSKLTEQEIAGSDDIILVAADSQKKTIAEDCASYPADAFEAFEPIFRLVDHVLSYPSP